MFRRYTHFYFLTNFILIYFKYINSNKDIRKKAHIYEIRTNKRRKEFMSQWAKFTQSIKYCVYSVTII